MSSLPTTQKAVLFNLTTSTLSLTTTAPLPPPSTIEHIIKVHSTAITNGELTWAPFTNWPNEHIPCFDVSGTILTRIATSRFQIGDKVYGRIAAGREGSAREFATILPSEAALVPRGLTMQDAASVPMSAHTAWQALFEQGLLAGAFSNAPFVDDAGSLVGAQAAAGKRVLVLNAAGGVGLFATQFCKLAGAYTVGTSSARNAAFLRELGVDEVLDYSLTSVADWVGGDEERKFDLVLDCVGGASMLDGWAAVGRNAAYVSVVPGFKTPEAGIPVGVRAMWFIMESRAVELERIGRFFELGLLRTYVDSVWGIEEYKEAFAKTAGGHARGKVVLRIGEEE
ncbi:NAD(P)-binding protein [Melanomma pulvis-pyrius CBS 109.77]|uniref:NAD(P)-binding protein n=1 Tax=Melanomma pulvis-pyrius CBS 109.77 TaxID=1314802 RepID=A0A6A6XLE3_9PLEO|nr:NAD(P)-binding protein [Melanomma pulvis-pyrius CBS 109.77]